MQPSNSFFRARNQPLNKSSNFCWKMDAGRKNSKLQIPNSKFQILNTKSQIPNSKLQIPNSQLQTRYSNISNNVVTVFQFRIVATTFNFFSIYFWSNLVFPAPTAYLIKILLESIAASSGLNWLIFKSFKAPLDNSFEIKATYNFLYRSLFL